MDNYLDGRWPKERPAVLPEQPKKKRKHRTGLWKNLLACFIGLIVIGGIGVGCFFGAGYLMEKLESGEVNLPGVVVITPPPTPTDAADAEWTADQLPQSEPDPSLQLELVSGEEEVLTASQIYDQILPSIVSIQALKGSGYSTGSGIIISASGYIITNFHIIDGATDLAVMRLSDREVFTAGLVGFDEELDLAVLKADGNNFTPARLGDSDLLKVGDPVYAIGNPMGYLYGTMTDGIVSGLSPERISELDYPGRLIQVSAALNSGNSGGALVDACGRVVGVTSSKITGIRGNIVIEGLGLAIPLSDVQGYLTRIIQKGYTARPSIGIMCSRAEVNGVVGIQIASVTEDTPAVDVFRIGDMILRANGVRVTTIDELMRVLSWAEPGDIMEFEIIRRGRAMTVSLELYDRMATA